jgi:hypothetical protein
MPTHTLDDALEERQDLLRRYKAAKRAERKALCLEPPYGDRLHDFINTLNHFKALEHGERMVEYVERECRRWLRDAPLGIRQTALELCGEREQAIRIRAGLHPIDDPLPGEPDNVFRKCKQAIGL